MGLSILYPIDMTHIRSSMMEKKANNIATGNASVMVCSSVDRVSNITIWSGSDFLDHSVLCHGIV